MTELPHRPRLADAALLRRHRVDGSDRWMLHDTHRSEVLELSVEQLEQCLACDGTRDVGGILLAAAREGAYGRASEVMAFLAELAERGLLADGTEPPKPLLETPGYANDGNRERPLAVLPGYRLHCTGRGSCCATYGSIPFSSAERRRADAAVPDVAEELGRHRFLPLHGAEPAALRAVTTSNGACAYLDDGRRCRIHAQAGAEAKPRTCQAFPAQMVDDGEVVRVSVAVECACVLASLEGSRGEPLVPEGIELAGLLPTGSRVPVLGERVAVTTERHVPRAEVREFIVAALAALPDATDGVAFAWTMARHIEVRGLDLSGLPTPSAPAIEELEPWLRALHAELRDKSLHVGWRSSRDRSRLRTDWLCNVAASLLTPAVARATNSPPDPRDARDEAFALRAALWGYRLCERDLVTSFRDRAIRYLLARRARFVEPDANEPARDHPIAAVEAMMRAHGIQSYVDRRQPS